MRTRAQTFPPWPGHAAALLPENGEAEPLYPDIGVVALPPESWSDHWMVRHQVLSRLTRYFRVVWMNPARSWSRDWKDAKPGGRQASWGSRFTPLDSGLIVFEPGRWLPEVWRPRLLSRALSGMRLRLASRHLRSLGCRKIVLYLWKPEQSPALDLLPHDLSCYHIFDEYSYSAVEMEVDPAEAGLIASVDQVFISSEAMLKKKGRFNARTEWLPNGVDFRAFSTPAAEPEDLRPIPRPRIGYIGVIKKQIDLELLVRLAEGNPGMQFVLVGPIGNVKGCEDAVAALRRLPNVHLLGSKAALNLPGYVQNMDVCLACYRVDGYTKFISPLKLQEYLAAGKPIIGADIAPIRPYADLVRIAGSDEEWNRALRECLEPAAHGPMEVDRRRARARPMDWQALVDKLAGILCRRLGLNPPVPDPGREGSR